MKILVTGAGRGGTNLATELIKKFNVVKFTSNVEDRNFFTYKKIQDKYATKLATENKGFTIEAIDTMLKNNPDLFIVFVVRNPIDNCLSKILRGQPKSKGGDSMVEELAPDATIDGSIKALNHMFKIYNFISENYKDRLIMFKMEDLIENTKSVIDEISKKIKINNNIDDIYEFYKNNRNKYQKSRYGDNLANNVNLYQDLDNNFNGFFKNNKEIVKTLENNLKDIINTFNYG